MSSDVYQRIKANPKFHELVAKRSRFAWTLAIVTLVLFYGFVLTVAFKPELLGKFVSPGSYMLTVGVLVELLMFILFWILTAVYVRRANTEFDALNQQIINDAVKGGK